MIRSADSMPQHLISAANFRIYTLAPSRVTINTDTEQHYDFMNSHPYYSVCLIRLSDPHKSRPGLINSQPLMYYAIA